MNCALEVATAVVVKETTVCLAGAVPVFLGNGTCPKEFERGLMLPENATWFMFVFGWDVKPAEAINYGFQEIYAEIETQRHRGKKLGVEVMNMVDGGLVEAYSYCAYSIIAWEEVV